MILKLAYYGHPILRKKTSPVLEIDDSIRQLVADMIETLNTYDGIGLAAPQVHHSLAIFITQVPIYPEDPDADWIPGPLRIFINPKILSRSDKFWTESEGCLSIPKVYGEVTRPFKITVEATDLEGKQFTEEFSGLEARCFMHENDHINGVLFIDRMEGKEKKALEPLLRELKKRNPS